MAERYRCEPGANVWHSSRDCPRWPLVEYWSHRHLPASAGRCKACASLASPPPTRPVASGTGGELPR
jgi:hypothetical protein